MSVTESFPAMPTLKDDEQTLPQLRASCGVDAPGESMRSF